jgi:hypothetical protein
MGGHISSVSATELQPNAVVLVDTGRYATAWRPAEGHTGHDSAGLGGTRWHGDCLTHNPKVAGSNPAPATKKALGIPTCAEGLLASGIAENTHVKPVLNAETILTCSAAFWPTKLNAEERASAGSSTATPYWHPLSPHKWHIWAGEEFVCSTAGGRRTTSKIWQYPFRTRGLTYRRGLPNCVTVFRGCARLLPTLQVDAITSGLSRRILE